MNIAFKFAELKSRVIKKGTTYIGQIIHNHFLDTEAMVRIDAEQYHMPEPMARFNITSVVDFIESEMAEGNRLNFGSCSVSLKTCGRFERANAPYSAKDNPIRVVMTPGKRMRAAGTKLKPVSETGRSKPWDENIGHDRISGERSNELDVIYLDGGLSSSRTSL